MDTSEPFRGKNKEKKNLDDLQPCLVLLALSCTLLSNRCLHMAALRAFDRGAAAAAAPPPTAVTR